MGDGTINMKIEAMITLNGGVAYVLDKEPELVWQRLDKKTLYGTDGVFYDVLRHSYETGYKAFGGREFEIRLQNGEIVKCNGQWWSAGHSAVEEHLRIKLTSVAAGEKEGLKKCFVFHGYSADFEKLEALKQKYLKKGVIYPLREYEKIIKYDDLWRKYVDADLMLEEILGRSAKQTKNILKNFSNYEEEKRRLRDLKEMEEYENMTDEEKDYRNFI